MAVTLYWHDYETTSVDPALGRPSQFAGVRTNEDLEIIGEPLMIYCKPSRDILPSPGACLVTGITPQKADAEGLPEPEFARRIYDEFIQPGTCGVGFNSLRFDDEVSRNLFYRNFFDPYEREWKNGNSRWDVIDMLRLARALRPDGIEWPNYEDGSPCFKLEVLSEANKLSHESAHDALSDVYATISMAKLLKQKQPKLFDYVFQHRGKRQVAELIDTIDQKPFLHVSSRLPRENGYLGLMMPIAVNPNNANDIICVNLNGDIGNLISKSADEIRERLYTRTEDLAEGEQRIPIKSVHINRCPVVATPKLLDEQRAGQLAIDMDRCRSNWLALKKADIRDKLVQVFSQQREFSRTNPEAMIYSGFLSNGDKPLLGEVRNSKPDELAGIYFSDSRYRELLFRYRARFYPESLTPDEQHQWEEQRFAHLNDPDCGYQTLDQYFAEIEEKLALPDCSDRDRKILLQLQHWGHEIL